jgi:hypothetical protein
MKLYIETENGLPKNHPALEENILQAFGSIPDNWVLFERIQKPLLDTYDVFYQEEPEYQLIDGIYKDVWMIRPMTAEEIATKKANTIAEWNNQFPSWLFNEILCKFEPPIYYPQDGKQYYWDEPSTSWQEVIINEQNT